MKTFQELPRSMRIVQVLWQVRSGVHSEVGQSLYSSAPMGKVSLSALRYLGLEEN